MKTFETSATVEEQGRVLLAGVPFAPGTEVEVTISPKALPTDGVSRAHGSVADAFGTAPALRRGDDILAQVRAEREEWGDH